MKPVTPALLLAAATIAAACARGGRIGDAIPDAGRNPDAGISDAGSDAGAADAGFGPPILPVGWDALRRWDLWPEIRIGERAYLRSTYDRAGGNEGADASHFLRQTATDFVTLDVAGPGILYFFRANHWHGSPWDFLVDGADTVVSDSSSATPDQPVAGSQLLPAAPFAPPVALAWPVTAGADVSWVPIPFARSLSLGDERTHYGTGYFIYDLFPIGATNLSAPIESWRPAAPPPDVARLLSSAGQDIAPAGAAVTGGVDVPASGTVLVAQLEGPADVRALRFSVPLAEAEAFGGAELRMTWDGRALPSVDAPVALFFGAGTLYNRSGGEWLVRALPVNVHFGSQTVDLAAYFPMPFARSARVELVGNGAAVPGVSWSIRTVPASAPPGTMGYFHATYHDQPDPPPQGQDLVLLDTQSDEGGGNWCGSFAGTSFIFSDRANLGTLEGDPRFFFDDSETPQAQGTGTEEWGAGGDYWEGGRNTTLPLAGHPTGAPSAAAARGPQDLIESAYRFLLADLVPFGRNARIQLEHGGTDDSTEHYRTVAYWYGLPGACLVPTDSLHVGDPQDEAAHGYASPQASGVDAVTSRYEWGVDHVGSTEIYPATADTGRHTAGSSTFTLALDPDNWGVMLRRKLDYGWPDQRATVAVADAAPGGSFQPAGVWYLAGSNVCLYSNPPGELDPPAPVVETSNRRWRDDEFLLPWQLTRGRSAIRVRIAFTPTGIPLQPGGTPPAQAWSEFRYTAYSYVLPPPP